MLTFSLVPMCDKLKRQQFAEKLKAGEKNNFKR